MFTPDYEAALAKLHAEEITFEDFLKEAGAFDDYQQWCHNHCMKPDEGSAQCYFDHFGFEESATLVKEQIYDCFE